MKGPANQPAPDSEVSVSKREWLAMWAGYWAIGALSLAWIVCSLLMAVAGR